MASANTNYSEIITTTLRNRSGKLADNVSANNALLSRLKEKGKIKPVSGGRVIVQELDYAENVTYTRYSGYETLNISPSDVFSAAEFSWKQAAVAVSISGLEQLQNSYVH
jgi:predicted transcriptional regulator of viral defense system